MEMMNYKQGEVIFREGSFEACMYSIAQGSVGIYLYYGDSEEKQIAAMHAGQYFGEMGLFESQLRSATAVALEDVQLSKITMDNIGDFFRTQPQQLLGIMRVLSGRVRALTNDYMEVCRAISEAAEAARKGEQKSGKLKARLAKFINDYICPNIGASSMSYAVGAYIGGSLSIGQNRMKLNRGDVVFRQGDASDCMYDILWGRVGIYAQYGSPAEKLLTVLNADQFFGEMGLLDQAPRSATAVALDDATQLRVVSAADFDAFLNEKPEKVLEIVRHLSSRLRDLTQDYMAACKAVSEAVNQEEKGGDPQKGWLREGMNRFVQDYCNAVQQISEHPEMSAYTPETLYFH